MYDAGYAVSFLQILAPELNDRLLADFLDMESSLIVSMHIQSVDQVKAIKTVKRKITDLDRSKIEEQKKAVRAGYDMDIIPSDLATYGSEAKKLLQDLQSRNERTGIDTPFAEGGTAFLRRTSLRFFFLAVSLPFGCKAGIMESGTGTVILGGGITMRALVFLLKLLLKILVAPVILTLTLFVWICVGIVYVSGLVLGLISMVIALLGVAVLLTCSLQNGIILLVMAFLISPYGLPMAAIWLLGKVQDLKFAIQDLVYG